MVLSDADVQTPERLAAALRHGHVDTVFITTALFNAMVTAVPDCFAAAGEVLVGGEQLNPRVMRRWYRDNAGSDTRLFNIYGPTESTTFALCHPVPGTSTGTWCRSAGPCRRRVRSWSFRARSGSPRPVRSANSC